MFLAKDILLLGFLPFLRWAFFLIIISAFMMVEDFVRRNRRVTMATVTVARIIVVPAAAVIAVKAAVAVAAVAVAVTIVIVVDLLAAFHLSAIVYVVLLVFFTAIQVFFTVLFLI